MAGRFPLYTDADIHGPVVEALIDAGWDVLRAIDALPEGTLDGPHFERAAREGRVTVTPPRDGVTADEAGAPQWEKTVIVYTYVTDALRGELPRLRSFLHRFGRETNQREVGVELSGGGEGWFFRIKKFDAA